jgi:hypothetical protein
MQPRARRSAKTFIPPPPVVPAPEQAVVAQPTADPSPARLKVEVEWASIVDTKGDVHVVGHYIGVLPQNAEWALDCALSGLPQTPSPTRSTEDAQYVLTDLTRRGGIRGALGDIVFFPWKNRGHVVLAGMGRLGTFKEPQLKTLASALTTAVARLVPNPTICTVLIGAGVGNLKVAEAVSGLIEGAARALKAQPALSNVTLRIVEYRLDRAYDILSAVKPATKKARDEQKIDIEAAETVLEPLDGGGVVPLPFGFSLVLASLAQVCHDGATSPLATAADSLLSRLPEKLKPAVVEALRRLGQQKNPNQLGLAFRLVDDNPVPNGAIADRISFSHDGARIQGAAITNLTTVSASTLEVALSWIDRVVETLRAPSTAIYRDRGRRAFRSLVHPVLREKLLETDPLVLELDRTMARVPWELVHNGDMPLGVLRPLARQLRTSYSPRPSDTVGSRTRLKALVIGDPDGTLPAAAQEAKSVYATLKGKGLAVDLRIGPPDVLELGSEPGVEPADLYDVLELLQSGDYDIVHFAGHAFFRPEHPDRSGWVFKDDVLTASKLEGVERVPRLIVANACVSATVSTVTTAVVSQPASASPAATGGGGAQGKTVPANDAGVVASLADEFFRRGVDDYIGTAWEVPEEPAKVFAERFYEEFLANWQAAAQSNSAPSTPLGLAVQRARTMLFQRAGEFTAHPSVWAAYQHYGDPTRTLADYRS